MPRAKTKAISNLERTEWWPLSALACTKVLWHPDPNQVGGGPNPWRVVAQFKLDKRWMVVYEAPLRTQCQEWCEDLWK